MVCRTILFRIMTLKEPEKVYCNLYCYESYTVCNFHICWHITPYNTVKQLFDSRLLLATIYFSPFFLHQHFRGDLFSWTAELDNATSC